MTIPQFAMHSWRGPHTVVLDPTREVWLCHGCGRYFTTEWLVRMGVLA